MSPLANEECVVQIAEWEELDAPPVVICIAHEGAITVGYDIDRLRSVSDSAAAEDGEGGDEETLGELHCMVDSESPFRYACW